MKKINKKQRYNYLRIYANMGKKSYSEVEKEMLVKTLVALSENFCQPKDLRFDILGSGYGISKSSPYCTGKTFRGKLDQKGYKKLEGIAVVYKDYAAFRLKCYLLLEEWHGFRLDIDFFWENNGNYDSGNALKIIEMLFNVSQINYCYGYVCDERLISGEWLTEKTVFGSTSYIPKEIEQWQQQITEIPSGAHRQLFDFNVLNFKQIENISEMNHFIKQPLGDDLEIWVKADA